MDIPWPANYLAVFRAQALASSVGEEFMDIRCAMAKPVSIASIQYGKMLAYALIPFFLVFLAICFWYKCGRRLGVPGEKRNAMITGTIVLLLYLLYPSIAAKTLGLWKCRYMDGIGSIFIMDPQVLCDDSSHLIWQNAVGVPCILLYIIGLPLFALCLMYKFRHKLHEQNTSIRIGLLYDGFKPESYMHEFFVVLRKVLIIVIAIFEVYEHPNVRVRFSYFIPSLSKIGAILKFNHFGLAAPGVKISKWSDFAQTWQEVAIW